MTSATKRARRARGTHTSGATEALYAKVDINTKAVFDRIADTAGVSLGVALEAVAQHIEMGDDGLPTWWPANQQEALDIPA